MKRIYRYRGIAMVISGLTLAWLMSGCADSTRASEGAAIGAGLGAIAGAVIGHQSGSTAEGAGIGAAAGALGGYIIGNEQDKHEQRRYNPSYDY